jgi:AcrR family transcriptional regulator
VFCPSRHSDVGFFPFFGGALAADATAAIASSATSALASTTDLFRSLISRLLGFEPAATSIATRCSDTLLLFIAPTSRRTEIAPRPDVRERHAAQRESRHRRLLDAARELLEELPWSQVSIELIAQRSGVKRTAFYKHFPDRDAVLLELLGELAAHLEAIPSSWERSAEAEPEAILRAAVATLVETFRTHGRLLRALADEAARNAEVERRYLELGARLSAGVAERIARDCADGLTTLTDPEEVATALVWMNERFLQQRFGRPPLGDAQRATDALATVWLRTLYAS